MAYYDCYDIVTVTLTSVCTCTPCPMQQVHVLSRGAPAIPIPAFDTHKTYTDLSTLQLTNMAKSLMLECISVTKQPHKLKTGFLSAGGTEQMVIGRAAAVNGTGLPAFRNAGLTEKIRGVRGALQQRTTESGVLGICQTLHKMLIHTGYPNSGRGAHAL